MTEEDLENEFNKDKKRKEEGAKEFKEEYFTPEDEEIGEKITPDTDEILNTEELTDNRLITNNRLEDDMLAAGELNNEFLDDDVGEDDLTDTNLRDTDTLENTVVDDGLRRGELPRNKETQIKEEIEEEEK